MTFSQLLADIATVHYGTALKEAARDPSGNRMVYGSSGTVGRHSDAVVDYPTIIIGRKGSVGKVTYAPEGGWPIDTAFYLELKDPDGIDLRYLYWALSSAGLQARAITTSIPGLSRDELYRVRLRLPPLAEQRRIAALLDRADAVRRKREESRRLVDDLLRSVFLDMFGDPVRNEKGWEVVRLQDVSHRIQIGPFGSLLHDSDYVEGGVPLINPMHIKDGQIVVDDHRTVTPQKAESLDGYRVVSGEVILGRRGEMGRCAIITPDQSGYLCGTGSIVIRTDDHLMLPEYLQMALSSTAIRGYLEQATEGATMPNLNRAIVADLPISLPPIAVQQGFAIQRERLLSCQERLEVVLQELGSLSTALLAQLLSAE